MALILRLPKRSRGFCLYTSKVMRAMSLLCLGFSRPRPYDRIPLCRAPPSVQCTPHTGSHHYVPAALGQTHPCLDCLFPIRGPWQTPCLSQCLCPQDHGWAREARRESQKGLVANNSPTVGLSPCWGSSSAHTPAPSGMCHPPKAGRSLHSPQRSHPPPAPVLASR